MLGDSAEVDSGIDGPLSDGVVCEEKVASSELDVSDANGSGFEATITLVF